MSISPAFKKIRDVCTIKPPKKEAKTKLSGNDLVSFVPMEQLAIGKKEIGLASSRPLSSVYSAYTYFAENDVLLAKITPCFENGKLGVASGLTNGVGFGSSEFVVFRCGPQINKDYLFYYLTQDSFRRDGARVMTGAVGHKRVPGEFIEETQLFLPDFGSQERIVAILDKAFEGIDQVIANTEKNLVSDRELFESILNTIFTNKGQGWADSCIADLCESIVDCVNRTAPKTEVPTEFKMIRTTNVRDGKINLEKVNYVTEETFKIWTRRQLPQKGDVILTREAPMGEVGMIENEDQVFLGQRIVSYRTKQTKILSSFLLYALRSNNLQEQIKRFGSGSTVQHMRVPDSKALIIPAPRIDQQKSLVAKLDFILKKRDELYKNHKKKLSLLNELKQSLLQKAFSGELEANDIKEEAAA